MGDFELVPHMRIDFSIIPIKGEVCYSFQLSRELYSSVKKLVGGDDVDKCDIGVSICHGESPFALMLRRFTGTEFDKQLRDGDSGYIVIQGSGLRFIDGYPGEEDWDKKFDNARLSLIHNLNCNFYNNRSHLLITHLHPSQDVSVFINLLSKDMDSDTRFSPILIVDQLPRYWLIPAQRPSLEKLFHSLAKIRDLDFGQNHVAIQFKNYKQCYKALKKLCSNSLKSNRNDGEVVVYELTLKDNPVASNVFDEVLAYNQSILNIRLAMLEKEFNTIEDIMEGTQIRKGSNKARALNHRAKMIEKSLDVVKSAMDEIGAESLRHQVSNLHKELSTMKVVLEDISIDPLQALEIRVQALENEVKTMKESTGVHNESPTDHTLKRCKRSRRD